MKSIVTGGAGFIGSHVADALVDLGHEVHIIDNMSAGKEENVNPKAILHKIDIRKLSEIKPIFKGTDFVFHLAAMPQVQYSIEHPEETADININGTQNVLIAAQKAGVKRLIYSASCAAYGDQEKMPMIETDLPRPKSPYGLQKYVGEHLCRLWSEIFGLPTISLRYFNVYGPRQSDTGAYALVIARFLKQMREGQKMTITGDGLQTRDFTHVRDVVRANILAMESQYVGKGEVINIGAGNPRSVLEIAKLLGGEYEFIAPRIEPRHALADNRKAKELLNWEAKEDFEKALIELKQG
ncbi:MAG TPA: NAD-dependent epimerase/dehydratase family protein [Candidatus Paceibacterota bacterium]|nr:NAD-dependent epimerase/dehydratase family protein [Candidatus Paceibacterota bacterium]